MAATAAVVVAAGRGLRAPGPIPKQFRRIGAETVLGHALRALLATPGLDLIQPVIHPDHRSLFETIRRDPRLLDPVVGGETRQASVRAGLEALARHRPDLVLVHDAARPFASRTLIERAIEAARTCGAAVPALPIADTVKMVTADGTVARTLDRASLRLIQTPQAFAFTPLLEAHRRAARAGLEQFTDDAALAEWAGMKVCVFAGEPDNIKITAPEDFDRAAAIHASALGDVRSASGFDVHAFCPGDHVVLGGVRIPHTQALAGHSDADVALHAATDALLGALADGDIGSHFPPNDPQWRGASSDRFLAFAVERVKARGGAIAHLDINIVCEAPRIDPYRDAMRAAIARIAGIDVGRVAVKATTSEKLGFIGRGEGIAAFATATVRLPWGEP